MTVDTNNLESVTEKIREKVAAQTKSIDATIKFAFADGGFLYIDGKSTPGAVHNNDEPAQCTVKVSFEDFTKMMNGKLDPTTAFMMQKIKIEGDMGVAMKLGKVIG